MRRLSLACKHIFIKLMGKKMISILRSKPLRRPNKNISVFQVTGLKTLGRVGTHFFFMENLCNFMHLKGILPFKNAYTYFIFLQKTLKNFMVSPVNLGTVRLLLTQVCFYLALSGHLDLQRSWITDKIYQMQVHLNMLLFS